MTKTLRAAVYGRESKNKTKSVDDQIGIGEATVIEHGWSHTGTWRDGTSASKSARKSRVGWPAVRGAIDAGLIDVLVLWEASRGSRTMTEWVSLLDTCRDRGVLVHIVSHDRTYRPSKAHDRKTLLNDGADAEYETNHLSERVCRGVDSAARAGGFHGRCPYGYTRVIVGERRDERSNLRPVREQRPDPDTAPVAVEIITRVAKQDSIRSIIRDLEARGVAAPKGARWSYATIRSVVTNRAYLGQRSHTPVNGDPTTVHEGTWPALVAGSIFDCANAVLDAPGRKSTAPGGLKHLLSVIMTAPCGARMGVNRDGNVIRYRCTADACVVIGLAEADAWVTELMVARLSRPDVRSLFAADDAATRAAKTELDALKRKLTEAQESYATDDGISAEALALTERTLAPKIADARRRATPSGLSVAMLSMLDAAEMGAEHVRPAWERLPLPAKRELIRLLCSSVTVAPVTSRLSRWSTWEQRVDAAMARIVVVPRGQRSALEADDFAFVVVDDGDDA